MVDSVHRYVDRLVEHLFRSRPMAVTNRERGRLVKVADDGSPTDAVYLNGFGWVGIGTTTRPLTGVWTNLICQGLTMEETAMFKEIDYSDGKMN